MSAAKSKIDIGIKPLGKSVVVELTKSKPISPGGIFIPESVQDPSEQKEATVIALGSGKLDDGKTHKFEVKPGDGVIFRSYSGVKIERNKKEYIVVAESDIVAILE